MQDYVSQLGHCLMDLQQDKDTPAKQQLQTWVVELQYLIVALIIGNPHFKKEVLKWKRQGSEVVAQVLVSELA